MSRDSINGEIIKHLTASEQVKFAIASSWPDEYRQGHTSNKAIPQRVQRAIHLAKGDEVFVHAGEFVGQSVIRDRLALTVGKSAVAPVSTAATTGGALFAPVQSSRVVGPVASASLLSALVAAGALGMPANTRVVTQKAGLTAPAIAEGAPYPAEAPGPGFSLVSDKKFGLVMVFSNEMLAASHFDDSIAAYVQAQLETAANNGTDAFLVGLFTSGGTAATSVAAGIASFAGDLRTSVWVGSPATLAGLADAANPNLGLKGGVYKGLPALPSYAAPAGTLFLVDVARLAIFDGPQFIERSIAANIVTDSDPANATTTPVSMFSTSQTAMKITRYADATLLSAPAVITLS